MILFLMTTLVFGLSFAAMALGVLLGRDPMHGGCASSSARCAACARPCQHREDRSTT